MHYQAHNVETIREGVEKYGVAAGARVMMSNEYLHADEAVKSGIYMTYYSPAKKTECFRVGSKSKCFCGHLFSEHNRSIGAKKVNTSCLSCPCKAFKYVPTRPEECGMWWLPRRKEFDVRTWKAKCKCKHAHDEHAPTRPHRCKMCGNCQDFVGDFACISCDCAWHDHEMLYETEQERKMEKKPTGQAYYPLSQHEDIQEMVFDPTKMNKALPFMRPRPKNDPTTGTAPKKAIVSQPKNLPIEYPQDDGYEEYKGNSQPVNFGVSGQSYSKPVSSQKAVSGRSGGTGIGFTGSRMSQQEEPEEENFVQGYKPSQKVGSTRTGGTGFGGQQEPEDYVYAKPSVSQKTVGVKTTGTGLSGTKSGVSSMTKTTATKSQTSVTKGSTQGVYKKPGERY